MAVTPELLSKIDFYEKKGYSPDEIVAGIKASGKYGDVVTKIDTYSKQGYGADEVIAGIRQSKATGKPYATITNADTFTNAATNAPEGGYAGFAQGSPEHRAQMEQFIRTQAPRDLKQEAVRGLPMGNTLADLSMGTYNDPVHPERTVDATIGPETKGQYIGTSMLRGVGNLAKNPAPQIEGIAAMPFKMAYDASKAQTEGNLGDYALSQLKGFVAPMGGADVVNVAQGKQNLASLNPFAAGSYPETRTAWEQNALGSALATVGVAKGARYAAGKITKLAEKTPVQLDSVISKQYQQAVRPSVSGTAGSAAQFAEANKKTTQGVYDIVRAKDRGELALGDEMAGEVPINKLPSTLQEHLQAVSQTRTNIFKKYDAMKKEAGDQGAVVDLSPVSAELKTAAQDPVLNDLRPETAKYMNQQAEILQNRGVYTAEQAQTAIATLNKDLESFYRNPTPDMAGKMVVDASIVKHIRQSLDKAIEQEVGTGYQALKTEYGRLASMEKDAAHRARVAGRAAPASLIDAIGGYLGSGEMVAGVLSMNPALIAKGGTMLALKSYIKKINSPDFKIKRMYKIADKNLKR